MKSICPYSGHVIITFSKEIGKESVKTAMSCELWIGLEYRSPYWWSTKHKEVVKLINSVIIHPCRVPKIA